MTTSVRPTPDWDLDQLEVILDDPGSWQLVVAGPGAGKSDVACQRIASLIDDGTPSARVLLVSFTRTAVAELRDRILLYGGERARGVRISTIDSQAWRLRAGFENEPLARALDDDPYSWNISRALSLFRERNHDLLEFMSSLEHLVIDEAQDVVGARADLVIEILHSLSEECGVTILADPAQAIYGFTSDGGERDGAAGGGLLYRLDCESPRIPVRRELREIYRIKNEQLRKVFRHTRRVVERQDGQGRRADRVIQVIRRTAPENLGETSFREIARKLGDHQDGSLLVLFRRRADVLLASSYCSEEGVQHRLRMSGLPTIVRPWLGWLFAEIDRDLIRREEFEELWSRRMVVASAPFEGEHREAAWTLLRNLAAGPSDGAVSLVDLHQALSRQRPPVEVCLPELGTVGPILGTIHASKGREADNVVLVTPGSIRSSTSSPNGADLEEGRVYYVGATRARRGLTTAHNTASTVSRLDSGRTYRKLSARGEGLPRLQLEVGLDRDVDRLAHISWQGAAEIQRVLAKSVGRTLRLQAVVRSDRGFDGRIMLRPNSPGSTSETSVGQLSKFFQDELREVWSLVGAPRAFRIAERVNYLYLAGVSTVVLSEGERSAARPPFGKSGFALAPVVRGFPVLNLVHRSPRIPS